MMESLSSLLFPIPPLLKPHRPNSLSSNSHQNHFRYTTRATLVPRTQTPKLHQNHFHPLKTPPFLQNLAKTQISFAAIELLTSLPSYASEAVASNEQVSDRIDLEYILVSIDDFFNRYPFFVAGCTFIWLVVLPVAEYYLSKFKFITALKAFSKLKEDPNVQLLDIRDKKSLASLGSPNLKILNKSVVQVEYSEEDEDGFLKNVLESFPDPANTSICILDTLDDNSIKVAELLSKNGFKMAYAIKGGVKGPKGWLAIQANLLPPSMHISNKNKTKQKKKLETNGGIVQLSEQKDQASSSTNGGIVQLSEQKDQASSSTSVPIGESQRIDIEHGNESTNSTPVKISSRSSSPYPNYPDLKPPSSPTPSKPQV